MYEILKKADYMKNKLTFTLKSLLVVTVAMIILGQSETAWAQHVKAVWSCSDTENLQAVSVEGESEYASLITPALAVGKNLSVTGVQSSANADEGFEGVTFEPPFVKFRPAVSVSSKTTGNCVSYSITPAAGHTFKPTKLSFDATKLGTDGGKLDVYIQVGSASETAFQTGLIPLRNKINASNSTGYTTFEFPVADYLVDGEPFTVSVYVYNLAANKDMGFRNLILEGMVDEPIYTLSHYLSAFSCSAGDLLSVMKDLKNGATTAWETPLVNDPTDFQVAAIEGYEASVSYEKKEATVTVTEAGQSVFTASIRFVVTSRNHGTAVALNRGLIGVPASNGILVSWRKRVADGRNTQYRLYRDGVEVTGSPFTKSNFLDAKGSTSSTYSLEVLRDGEIVERQDNVAVWSKIYKRLPLQTPTDERGLGATYTPNDCSAYDMDGDGEYEIIVKWDPNNSKDSAGSGTTSSVYIDCYKLDGTLLWRINLGQNIRAGAHYTQFLCYDFDGDGFGEMVVKTAPGTIDGEGNYVLMGNDDPKANYVNSKGHITSGPEYLTIFDGVNGAAIHTVKYEPAYGDVSTSVWGDSNANRSDRYRACVAFLDGEHPSAVMMRGYYAGSFAAAYDFDGQQLIKRWYHNSSTKNKGTYGEGHHSVTVGDVDGDGCDEIVVGSACIDHDGSTLWRGGTGHGDALHLGDFDLSNEGMEVFAVYESKTAAYDASLRDAKTGKVLASTPQTNSDTGRGLILDCDSKHEGAEFFHSSSSSLYNVKGQVICPWQNGTVSSSSINYRIYWTGDLYDEYHDRQHIDKWDSEYQSYGRTITLYNEGGASSINGSKYNPNLQADLFGDWREEAIYWVTNEDGSHSLTIFSTNHPSDYSLPTLRDDHVYDMAIVWQNVGYNQPPHLSYSPIDYYTIKKEASVEEQWIPFYSDYKVDLPEDVEVYIVNTYSKTGSNDTVSLKHIETDYIPAAKPVLLRYTGNNAGQLRFKPSDNSTAVSGMTTNYLRGIAYEGTVTSTFGTITNGERFYEFRHDETLGYGYFAIESKLFGDNTSYLRMKQTKSFTPADYYLLGRPYNNTTAIESIRTDAIGEGEVFDLMGRKVIRVEKGFYLIGGKKVLVN